MTAICSLHEFNSDFGSTSAEALKIITQTYPLVKIYKNALYYSFSLEALFSEAIDLFSVDVSMVTDCFVINTMFADETIKPDITITLSELVQKKIDYEPVNELGEFWLTFGDIRSFYGEVEFDKEMLRLFPHDYEAFKNYLLE